MKNIFWILLLLIGTIIISGCAQEPANTLIPGYNLSIQNFRDFTNLPLSNSDWKAIIETGNYNDVL